MCVCVCVCFVPYYSAQQQFKSALRSSVIRLRVLRRRSPTTPPVEQPDNYSTATVTDATSHRPRGAWDPSSAAGEPPAAAPLKVPPAVPLRSSTTSLSTAAKNKFTQISSTRLIGRVINIQLTKGQLEIIFHPGRGDLVVWLFFNTSLIKILNNNVHIAKSDITFWA